MPLAPTLGCWALDLVMGRGSLSHCVVARSSRAILGSASMGNAPLLGCSQSPASANLVSRAFAGGAHIRFRPHPCLPSRFAAERGARAAAGGQGPIRPGAQRCSTKHAASASDCCYRVRPSSRARKGTSSLKAVHQFFVRGLTKATTGFTCAISGLRTTPSPWSEWRMENTQK